MCLRRQHRVVGVLTGCVPQVLAQVSFSGLPLILAPEEVDLLVEREKVARLVSQGGRNLNVAF